MDIRPIDANALLEKIRFREGPFAGQREIFLIEGEPTLSLNTLRDAIYEDAVAHGLWLAAELAAVVECTQCGSEWKENHVLLRRW